MPTRFEEMNAGLKSTDIKGKAYVEVNAYQSFQEDVPGRIHPYFNPVPSGRSGHDDGRGRD